MNGKDVEVRLERSLRNQVSSPALDARFNAAVFARIAAQEASVPEARRSNASRWLLASNVIGIAVSLALIVYFVAREFTGIQIDVSVPLPTLSDQATASLMKSLGWGVAAAAVAFGFAFTRMGRRALEICRSEFA
jgi:hypothetical protein